MPTLADVSRTRERATLVRDDAPVDAEALDRTPFTPRGIGGTLGSMLAMIGALATCVVELCDHLEGGDDAGAE